MERRIESSRTEAGRALRGEGGQSAVEYIAALLVVSAIIAGVLFSPIGARARTSVGELSCQLLNEGSPTDCEPDE